MASQELEEAAGDVVGALPPVQLLPHGVHDQVLDLRLHPLVAGRHRHVE